MRINKRTDLSVLKRRHMVIVWFLWITIAFLISVSSVYTDENSFQEAENWFHKGMDFGLAGRYDDALDAFEQAINIYPEYAEAFVYKGRVLQHTGRYAEALNAYEKAIILKPGYGLAKKGKSSIIEKINREEELKEDSGLIVAISEEEPADSESRYDKLWEQEIKEVSDTGYVGLEWFGLGLGSENAQELQRNAVDKLGLPLEIECRQTGMLFRLIPGGEFLMGSPAEEPGRLEDEGPPRKVRLSVPFYMAICPVTQAQYKKIMGDNPSHFLGDDLPVHGVSWNEAMIFCKRLSARTGLDFSLPTEAQWEFASRAGTTSAYFFFTEFDEDHGVNQLDKYAWYGENTLRAPRPPGKKEPNAFGLYDMYGNVWEWCFDRYKDSYEGLNSTDPQGPDTGDLRVLRGGSWSAIPRTCRSAFRNQNAPDAAVRNAGFRVVLKPPLGD